MVRRGKIFCWGALILSLVCLVFLPFAANASVVINEVMYDAEGSDSGREWVEICSFGEAADISGWYLSEGGVNHRIKPNGNEEDLVLKEGQCAVISNDYKTTNPPEDNFKKFLADFPDFSGTLLGASFFLRNSGETIEIKDKDKNVIDSFSYSEETRANGDGKTLQRRDSEWIAAVPTPGRDNFQEDEGGEGVGDGGVETEGGGGNESKDVFEGKQLYVDAGKNKIAVVGSEVVFEGRALGFKKEPLENARYLWSFGDGSTAEGKKVKHIYQYPADYIVVLNVSSGKYSASDRAEVRVLPNEVAVEEADEEKIILYNGSSYDLDISNWCLKRGEDLFRFPLGTIIKKKSKLPVPFSVSGLAVKKGESVQLLYPNLAPANVVYNNIDKKEKKKGEEDEVSRLGEGVAVEEVFSKDKRQEPEVWLASEKGIHSFHSSQAANIVIASNDINWKVYKWLAVIGIGSSLLLISFLFLRRFSGRGSSQER